MCAIGDGAGRAEAQQMNKQRALQLPLCLARMLQGDLRIDPAHQQAASAKAPVVASAAICHMHSASGHMCRLMLSVRDRAPPQLHILHSSTSPQLAEPAMATRQPSLVWVPLLASLLLSAGAAQAVHAAQASCGSGVEGALTNSCGAAEPQAAGPELHVQDGLLTDELRQELIQVRAGRSRGCRSLPQAPPATPPLDSPARRLARCPAL